MIRSHYDILGLERNFSPAEVKEAHLQLTMLMNHQRVLSPVYSQLFRAYLDESYQVLSDPDWRLNHWKTLDGLQSKLSALTEENHQLKAQVQQLQGQIAGERIRIQNLGAEYQQIQKHHQALLQKLKTRKGSRFGLLSWWEKLGVILAVVIAVLLGAELFLSFF